MKTICAIIPVFNEEKNLPPLYERLSRALSGIEGWRWQIIFVDDHSTDRTPGILRALAERETRVTWMRLSRNSGSHIACIAGLDHCHADAAVILAADLQDPPELIPELLAQHAEGAQLVWAVRRQRKGESWFTRAGSQAFCWLMSRLSEIRMPPKGADFLLADRCVVEAFRHIPERNLSLFVAFAWLGFRQVTVPYVKETRHAGSSKWTLRRKVVLAIDSFVGFSYLPLRCLSYLGFLFAGLGLAWAAVLFVLRVTGVTQTTGFASIMIAILVMGGLQMIMLGVLGEYLWRTLEESRQRPRYFVESSGPEAAMAPLTGQPAKGVPLPPTPSESRGGDDNPAAAAH